MTARFAPALGFIRFRSPGQVKSRDDVPHDGALTACAGEAHKGAHSRMRNAHAAAWPARGANKKIAALYPQDKPAEPLQKVQQHLAKVRRALNAR